MTLFAVIEDYRRELRALPFTRLGADQRNEFEGRYRSMHHSDEIEVAKHVLASAKALVV